MTNLIFNRESLKVVDLDREPLAFELSIKNVNIDDLEKEIEYAETIEKLNDNGENLYILPQDDVEKVVTSTRRVKSIEESESPVMINVADKIPLLDSNGEQVQYELTNTIITPATYDDYGNILTEETVETVGTGQFIKCFTVEEREVQEVDEDNNPLYWNDEEFEEIVLEPQESLEITKTDERWTDSLQIVTEQILKTKNIKFNSESMNMFAYRDVVEHKAKHLADNTLYVDSVMIEDFENTVESSVANFGLGFVNIPIGGFIVFKPLEVNGQLIKLYKEVSVNSLDFYINDIKVNSNDEVLFDSNISNAVIRVENNGDKAIDIDCLALMW